MIVRHIDVCTRCIIILCYHLYESHYMVTGVGWQLFHSSLQTLVTLSTRMTGKNGNAGLTSTATLWDWHPEVNSNKSAHCCTVSENKPMTFYLQLVFQRRIGKSIQK